MSISGSGMSTKEGNESTDDLHLWLALPLFQLPPNCGKEGRRESVIWDTNLHVHALKKVHFHACMVSCMHGIATSSPVSTCGVVGMPTVHVHNPQMSHRTKEYAPWLFITSAQKKCHFKYLALISTTDEEGCMCSHPIRNEKMKNHTVRTTSRCPLHKWLFCRHLAS